MTKTMKVEGPLHVICQCDKCKPQISFNAEVIGYVEPQRTWVGLTDGEKNDCLVSADPCEALAEPEARQLIEDVEQALKEKNT